MRFTALLFSLSLPLNALTIQIDYSLDSNGFFTSAGNPQGGTGATQAVAALEAAAARWSAIINETLPAVTAIDHHSTDVRLSFPDPSNFAGGDPGNALTYEVYEISSAASSVSDSLVNPGQRPPANQYANGISIPENTFIIYVGGRPLQDDAFSGAFIGHNYDSVANDPDSILNRGFNAGMFEDGFNSLPAWGSSISFNSREDWDGSPLNPLDRRWHFDHTTEVPSNAKDFYSVALAAIGRSLGVGLFYQDWTRWKISSEFRGPFTRAAYLEEFEEHISGLDLQSPDDQLFERGTYTSQIFTGGNPNFVDTVGPGVAQPLLFQARATPPPLGDPARQYFIPGIVHGERFEITNIDVAAVRDIGWNTISSAPVEDVTFATLTRNSLGRVTLTFPSEPGATYTIQTSTDMTNWLNVSPELNSEGTSTDWQDGEPGFTDPLGSSFFRNKKFYRVFKND